MTRALVLRLALLLAIAMGLGIYLAGREEQRITPAAPGAYPRGTGRIESGPHGSRVLDSREAVMGTHFAVEVAAPDAATAQRAADAAYATLFRIEQAMSNWTGASTIARVNREASARPVAVDAETWEVLQLSRWGFEASRGAFDPSVGPLMRLWKPLARQAAVPDDEAILRTLALVDFDRVTLSEADRTVRFERAGMRIDLGGVAKGYGVDRAVEAALSAGATAVRINGGGDLALRGFPPWSPEGFEIRVRDPSGGPADALPGHTWFLTDAGVATSGNYERYTEIDGRRYSHILDPRTGRPVADAVAQVTVVAGDAAHADLLATALAVLGPVEGLALVEEMDAVEALFLTRDGEGYRPLASSGFPGDER